MNHERRDSALLLATIFAVILGAFAMHALSSHERAPAGHSAVPFAAEAADPEHGSAHAETKAPQSDLSDGEGPGAPSHHDGSGAAELYMALLCFLAALIALVLNRGLSRPILHVVPRWIGPHLASYVRAADPPCLHLLSILRC